MIDNLNNFEVTKKVSCYLEIDEYHNKFRISISNIHESYNFSDLIDFELLGDDGESISKGGLGRVLVGGALFGGIGAIVGGVTGSRKNKKCVLT